MPRIDLAGMTQRAKPRLRAVTFRPIRIPATLATDLFQTAYKPMLSIWSDALGPIMTEYERTLAQVTTDSPVDVTARLESADGLLLVLSATLRDRLARWARRLEATHRQRWRASVLTATGIDLATMIGPEAARVSIATSIERNVALVSSVSDQARGRIADAVFRGFTNRTPAKLVARELTEALGMARRRAINIAADQSTKLASALDQERRREAGITEWKWVHSGKQHPREEHEARDGNIYSDDEPPADMPGELPFCGCSSAAHLDLGKMLADAT